MVRKNSIESIHKQTLNRLGKRPYRRTKKLLTPNETPDTWKKTPSMKNIEILNNIKIEDILFKYTVREIAKMLNNTVDYTTIHRWREKYMKHRNKLMDTDIKKYIEKKLQEISICEEHMLLCGTMDSKRETYKEILEYIKSKEK